jgi:hypothetical protein
MQGIKKTALKQENKAHPNPRHTRSESKNLCFEAGLPTLRGYYIRAPNRKVPKKKNTKSTKKKRKCRGQSKKTNTLIRK